MLHISPALPPSPPSQVPFAAKAASIHQLPALTPPPLLRHPMMLENQSANSGGFRCNLILSTLKNNSCQWFQNQICDWWTTGSVQLFKYLSRESNSPGLPELPEPLGSVSTWPMLEAAPEGPRNKILQNLHLGCLIEENCKHGGQIWPDPFLMQPGSDSPGDAG